MRRLYILIGLFSSVVRLFYNLVTLLYNLTKVFEGQSEKNPEAGHTVMTESGQGQVPVSQAVGEAVVRKWS